MTSRRKFIQIAPVCGAALIAGRNAFAADPPMVDEKDAQAAALGYVADAAKADKAKFKSYVAGHNCANCQLYMTKTAAAGSCGLFPGKYVAAKGWCSAHATKA